MRSYLISESARFSLNDLELPGGMLRIDNLKVEYVRSKCSAWPR